jgi:hypothetical protein
VVQHGVRQRACGDDNENDGCEKREPDAGWPLAARLRLGRELAGARPGNLARNRMRG